MSVIATLVAEIGAKTDGLEKGLAQSLGLVKSTSTQMQSALGGIGGAFQGDRLGADFAQFTSTVTKGTNAITNSSGINTGAVYDNVTANQMLTGMLAGLSGKQTDVNALLLAGARAAELNSGQIFNLASASGLFSDEQLKAAANTEILAKRATMLAQGVQSGAISAEQAGVQYANYASELDLAAASHGSFLGTIGKTAAIATAVTAGVVATGVAVKKAWDFGEAGANVLRLREGIQNVASAYGTSGDEIIRAMTSASRGTVAQTDLILAANRAMLLGVSTDADELAAVTEVAIARGRAMGLSSTQAINDVFTGIGRLSPKILDNLGIVTNATQRYQEYADQMGISVSSIDDFTKRQILTQAVIKDGEKLLDENGNIALDTAASYEQLSAAWKDFYQEAGVLAAGTFEGGNQWLTNALKDLQGDIKLVEDYSKYKAEFAAGLAPGRVAALPQLPSAGAALMGGAPTQTITTIMMTQKEFAEWQQEQQDIEQGRAAWAARYTAQIREVADAEKDYLNLHIADDYALQLDVGQNLTDMTEDYTNKLAAMNEQLTAITDKYGMRSSKVAAAQEDIAKKTLALNDAQAKSYDEMALGILGAKEATDKQQLDYARASGLITQDAYDQVSAMNAVAEAYAAGKLSAENAANAVDLVRQEAYKVDGLTAEVFIDVWIRQHGNLGLARPEGAATTTEILGGSTGRTITHGRALGGPVGAGNIYSVAEKGQPEMLTVGGQSYLLMGGRGGYVTPAKGGEGAAPSTSGADIAAIVANIPTARENAKALAREIAKMGAVA